MTKLAKFAFVVWAAILCTVGFAEAVPAKVQDAQQGTQPDAQKDSKKKTRKPRKKSAKTTDTATGSSSAGSSEGSPAVVKSKRSRSSKTEASSSENGSPQAPAPNPTRNSGSQPSSDANAAPSRPQQQASPSPRTNANRAEPSRGSGMVWVNTDSGIYHKEGTRYYGKTKSGKYMSEADAAKAGYRPAKNQQ